jgi:hypothetical protein
MVMAQYARLIDSKEFRTQAEAEAWAKEQKRTYKQQDATVKYDIAFVNTTRQWVAKLYLKV